MRGRSCREDVGPEQAGSQEAAEGAEKPDLAAVYPLVCYLCALLCNVPSFRVNLRQAAEGQRRFLRCLRFLL